MKFVLRMGVTAAAGAIALALSSSALAQAVTPKLTVSAGGPNLTINAQDQATVSGDPLARLEIFIPTGFVLKLPPVGTVFGTATTHALVKDIDPGLEQNLSGDVVAISPTDPSIAYEAANCDNGPHLGAMLVRFTGQQPQISQTIGVPIFVDATTGSETQLGASKLVACMKSPDLLPGTANRSPFGTKFDTFRVQLNGFKLPTKTGDYRWRSLWTPFMTNSATMNTAGSAEAQSVIHAPVGVLTLTAKSSHGRFALSGALLIGGEPANGVRVALTHGATTAKQVAMGSVKTNGVGTYLKLATIKTSAWFQAGATIVGKDLGPGNCQPSFGTGVTCTDATIGDTHILSAYLHVKR